jgi:hypothetical protein
MPQPSMAERVGILEEKVGSLAELPDRLDRVESQIVQLRNEMRSEFAAIRAGRSELATSSEMHELGATLRGEMREGDEETRRFMRVLHDDLVARIAAIGESSRSSRKRR